MHNNSQPKIDMRTLQMINKKYNFKVKQIRPDLVLITTGLNEWMIEIEEYGEHNKKNIILRHKNTRLNKERWHIQRRFYDLKWTLGHIDYHDNKRMKVNFNKK